VNPMSTGASQPPPHDTAHHEPSGDYDALADLFLGEARAKPVLRLAVDEPTGPVRDAEAGRPAAPARPAGPRVEAMVLGHLPVMAGAWVVQYAKHVADAGKEPVGLVRVQGGQTWVDLVLPRGDSPRTTSRIGAGAPASDLAQAAARGAREARTWLVRVDELSEPELVTAEGIDAVTLLTGADEAAMAASYRTVRGLCEGVSGFSDQGREGLPEFRLAIMGAEEARAREAERRISKAAATFLGRPVSSAAYVGQVGACTTQVLLRQASAVPLREVVSAIRCSYGSPSGAASTPPGAGSAPPAAPGPPSPEDAANHPARLLELKPLATRCPHAPGVWLAHAEDGSLHLLAKAGESPGGCVGELLSAAAWADQHAALLETAHAGALRELATRGPTLHVLVRDAKSARALLDTGVRVHLVVGAPTGEAAHPLN
jgi:hypothetical protein